MLKRHLMCKWVHQGICAPRHMRKSKNPRLGQFLNSISGLWYMRFRFKDVSTNIIRNLIFHVKYNSSSTYSSFFFSFTTSGMWELNIWPLGWYRKTICKWIGRYEMLSNNILRAKELTKELMPLRVWEKATVSNYRSNST